MSKEIYDNYYIETERNLPKTHQVLTAAVEKQSRSGILCFIYQVYGENTRLLFLVEKKDDDLITAKFFAEVSIRPGIKVNELETDSNPWDLILNHPKATTQNVCRQLPSFVWFHHPSAAGTKIRVYSSHKALRAQRPTASIII